VGLPNKTTGILGLCLGILTVEFTTLIAIIFTDTHSFGLTYQIFNAHHRLNGS